MKKNSVRDKRFGIENSVINVTKILKKYCKSRNIMIKYT